MSDGDEQRETLKPIDRAAQKARRLTVKGELALALFPTLTILIVLALLEAFSRQRLLFASLASSAFLIYLDPRHEANTIRTLVVSQTIAALVGLAALWIFSPGYLAAAAAMTTTIALMILLDAMHPPAVSTALTFAFRDNSENSFLLFAFGVGIIVVLVGLQKSSLWLLARNGFKPKPIV